jgi:N-methylhydantoinase A
MAGAVRQVSIRRGIDVRDHALVAFGGAGPLHAAELARLLGIATVVIPPHPGLGSCDGLLLADIAVDDVRTCVLSGPELSASAIGPVLASLRERLGKRLPATGHIDFTADMRYVGMGSELRVRLAADDLGAQDLAPLLERFHTEHQRLFGFSYRDRHPVQLLALRATLSVARGGRIGNVKLPCDDAGAAAIGVRHALLAREHGFEPVPVFRRDQLPAGLRLDGPAFIDQYDSTTIVMHNQAMHVDPHGNLILGLRR